MKIFSVFDSKAKFYSTPFFLKSKAEALRGFMTVANDKKTSIGQFPADYTLVEIGEFDELTGKVSSHLSFNSLGTAMEFVNFDQGAVSSPHLSAAAHL